MWQDLSTLVNHLSSMSLHARKIVHTVILSVQLSRRRLLNSGRISLRKKQFFKLSITQSVSPWESNESSIWEQPFMQLLRMSENQIRVANTWVSIKYWVTAVLKSSSNCCTNLFRTTMCLAWSTICDSMDSLQQQILCMLTMNSYDVKRLTDYVLIHTYNHHSKNRKTEDEYHAVSKPSSYSQ